MNSITTNVTVLDWFGIQYHAIGVLSTKLKLKLSCQFYWVYWNVTSFDFLQRNYFLWRYDKHNNCRLLMIKQIWKLIQVIFEYNFPVSLFPIYRTIDCTISSSLSFLACNFVAQFFNDLLNNSYKCVYCVRCIYVREHYYLNIFL